MKRRHGSSNWSPDRRRASHDGGVATRADAAARLRATRFARRDDSHYAFRATGFARRGFCDAGRRSGPASRGTDSRDAMIRIMRFARRASCDGGVRCGLTRRPGFARRVSRDAMIRIMRFARRASRDGGVRCGLTRRPGLARRDSRGTDSHDAIRAASGFHTRGMVIVNPS